VTPKRGGDTRPAREDLEELERKIGVPELAGFDGIWGHRKAPAAPFSQGFTLGCFLLRPSGRVCSRLRRIAADCAHPECFWSSSASPMRMPSGPRM
jgi:hypothetical protein